MSIFQTVKVKTLAVDAVIGQYERTAEIYSDSLRYLLDKKGSVVICPEISLGYERHRGFLQPEVCEMEWRLMLEHIVPQSKDCLILWGLPIRVRGAVYNGMAYIANEKVIALSAKTQLAQGGIYQDGLYFSALEPGFVTDVEVMVADKIMAEIPFGDVVVDAMGVRVKALNCEDLWTVQGPIIKAQEQGVDLICWMNTSHEQIGKEKFRHKMLEVFSSLSSTAIVSCNVVGLQGGNHIFGGGSMAYQAGKCLGAFKRYYYKEAVSSKYLIDLHSVRRSAQATQSQRPNPMSSTTGEVALALNLISKTTPQISAFDPSDEIIALEYSKLPDEWLMKFFDIESPSHSNDLIFNLDLFVDDSEAIDIVCFGIWKHFVNAGLQGWIVPNSGGSDSRVSIQLIVNAIHIAWNTLGEERFKEQVSFVEGLSQVNSADEFASLTVFAPYIRGVNSSDETENAARVLAESLKVNFGVADISELEKLLNKEVSLGIFEDPNLSWENQELLDANKSSITALENCPARLRGLLAWQFANLKQLVLVTTGNQDEVWSKYFTLGGDAEGGLAPLSGVEKPRIYRMQCLLSLILDIVIPMKDIILESVATAELKPESYAQTDDLECGPFHLRNHCARLIIGEDRSALQAFLMILQEEYGASPSNEEVSIVHFTVRKFVVPALRDQWARTQLSLGFVVEAADTFPGTDHSNRRAYIDKSYVAWVEELDKFFRNTYPDAKMI